MIEDDSEYYYDNDFNIEAVENSVVLSETSCLLETNKSSIQLMPYLSTTSLKYIFVLAQKPKKKYKYKEPSFTHKYFKMIVNKNDEDDKKYGTEYKNIESSTRNLITYLRDSYEILDDKNIKKLQNFKITDFVQKVHSYPPYIQKQYEEIILNFKIKDVILENKYVSSSYSGQVIVDELHKCIKAWNHRCRRIKRLSCIAHTLQLVIGKGLILAEVLVIHAR
ncbi:11177_t:CDS:2, partial [Scutellospora calospora]